MQNSEISVKPVVEYSVEAAIGIGRLMPYLDPSFNGQPLPRFILERLITSPYHDKLIAVHGQVIVGAATLSMVMGDGLSDHGHLENFVVDPSIRRRGIGGMLLRATEIWCRDQHLPYVLFVTEQEREGAIRLYERWGAVRVTDGSDNQNGILYRKDFDHAGRVA